MGIYSFKNTKRDNLQYYITSPETASEIIVIEASKSNKDRKYKCPYCDHRDIRVKLVDHVEEEHEDMIPQDYTPARVVFNYLNKKECGRCIMCGEKTTWNEEVWKYNRLCSDKCHKEYVKVVKSRMIKKYGKEHILDDPEQQKKMLKNRKISGTYKFSDGGVREYCGTYERKLLEFYDKVLNVPSKDIITPGPVIEYEYEGKKRKWILDLLYVPANLAHDVKDGGDNPNNRQMDDYRAKQVAKEKAIGELQQYNYIRLTNNNFQQLLLILAELKENMLDGKEELITRINEGSATAGALANASDMDVYITPYYMNNAFIGTGVCSDKYFKDLHIIKDGKCVKTNLEELEDYELRLYKYKGKKNIKDIIESCKDKEDLSCDYFYTYITEKRLLSSDQFLYDELLEQTLDGYSEYNIKKSIIESSLKHQLRDINNENYYITENDKSIQDICKDFKNIIVMSDLDGYFGYNHVTNCRTISFNKIDAIYSTVDGMIDHLRVLDNIKI